MKKQIFSILLTLLCVSLTACDVSTPSTPSSVAGYPYTFTDAQGDTVSLTAPPKRVAVLFSSFAEMWQLAGGTVSVTVAESVSRGLVSADVTLVDSGAGHTDINREALLAAKPDFVIGTADFAGQADAVSFCRSVGIPAAVFRVENVSQYVDTLKIFCDITNNPTAYQTYGVDVETKVSHILGSVKTPQNPPKILFIRTGSSTRSTKAKIADNHYVCAMLKELGTKNIAENTPLLQGDFSLEAVIQHDPAYIFISTMGNDAAATAYMQDTLKTEGWSTLSAVQNNRVIFLPRDLFHYKPNARWGEAYAYLAEILYTE